MSVGAGLNYDGTVAGNRNYEVAGLGIRSVSPSPSELTDDGSLPLQAGTASALYTAYRTFQQGTYLAYFYNCLTAASHDHYVQTTAEANSGTIWSGFVNRYYSDLGTFHQSPFVFKVRSATANVRFKVHNPHSNAATLTHTSGNCAQFFWTQIGL